MSTTKQILVIHGGSTFGSHEEYLKHLKSVEIKIERLKKTGWKRRLRDALGDEFEVFTPSMPNADNAQYQEWKIWFEKILPFLKDRFIFIGHSLGGIFLAKYLSEEKLRKKALATFLVAAPFGDLPTEKVFDFKLPKSLKGLELHGGIIRIYHSHDDPVVPFSHAEEYARALPRATLIALDNQGHFSGEEFPEIIQDLKNILAPTKNWRRNK